MALSHLHAINAAGLGNLPPSTLPPPLIQPSQPPPPLLQPPRSVQQPLVQMPSYPTFVSVNISMAAFQQQLQYNEKVLTWCFMMIFVGLFLWLPHKGKNNLFQSATLWHTSFSSLMVYDVWTASFMFIFCWYYYKLLCSDKYYCMIMHTS